MKFVQASPSDKKIIATLMLFAMKEIAFDFIGEKNEEKALIFLEELIEQPNNQYSYQNVTLAKDNQEIVGAFTLYNGADLIKLRQPVLDLLKSKYQREIFPQEETEAGEMYIDTIAVLPQYRGKGYGGIILDYIIEEYGNKKNATIGLLVDLTNPKAKKLYESKGFKYVGEKQLMNENHEHLQYKKGFIN